MRESNNKKMIKKKEKLNKTTYWKVLQKSQFKEKFYGRKRIQ